MMSDSKKAEIMVYGAYARLSLADAIDAIAFAQKPIPEGSWELRAPAVLHGIPRRYQYGRE